MRYLVRQKIFSIRDKFTIKDESDNDVYYVESQLLSFGKKLRIYDLQENELSYIEQQLFRFMPEYNIYISGQPVTTIKKRFALFKNDFEISSSSGEYAVEGDFFAHEFSIYRNGNLIGGVSKKLFSFTDTYGVDVEDEKDPLTTLALAIVIDMVCHESNR